MTNTAASLKPERMENPNAIELAQKLAEGRYERLLLAEGDSWFDMFTPAPLHEPNLLDAIRIPRSGLLVDISHIGDTAREMATDPQARRTLDLLDLFEFDVLLLSAGGNDLKNAFREAYLKLLVHRQKHEPVPAEIARIAASPGSATDILEEVVAQIVSWINLRERSKLNRSTPVVLHGYDYLQPRPAPARAWLGGPRVSGPWIHSILAPLGMTDPQMWGAVKDVIDRFNELLCGRVAILPNVQVLDTRGKLVPATPGSEAESGDWMDEIHATPAGWAKLADAAWNPLLAELLR